MLKPKLDSARDISRRLQADLGFVKKRLDVAHQGERARANVWISPKGFAEKLEIETRTYDSEDSNNVRQMSS